MKVIGPDSKGLYRIQGYPAGASVGMFFGILLLIFGIFGILINPIASMFVLLFANVIIYLSNRYAKGLKTKAINEYDAQLRQQKSDINFDAL